jgi:hypothetical protein
MTSVITAAAPPRAAGGQRMTPTLALGDLAAITRRNLLHIVRTPQLLGERLPSQQRRSLTQPRESPGSGDDLLPA